MPAALPPCTHFLDTLAVQCCPDVLVALGLGVRWDGLALPAALSSLI